MIRTPTNKLISDLKKAAKTVSKRGEDSYLSALDKEARREGHSDWRSLMAAFENAKTEIPWEKQNSDFLLAKAFELKRAQDVTTFHKVCAVLISRGYDEAKIGTMDVPFLGLDGFWILSGEKTLTPPLSYLKAFKRPEAPFCTDFPMSGYLYRTHYLVLRQADLNDHESGNELKRLVSMINEIYEFEGIKYRVRARDNGRFVTDPKKKDAPYIVLPRVLIEHMHWSWQKRFRALLEDLAEDLGYNDPKQNVPDTFVITRIDIKKDPFSYYRSNGSEFLRTRQHNER